MAAEVTGGECFLLWHAFKIGDCQQQCLRCNCPNKHVEVDQPALFRLRRPSAELLDAQSPLPLAIGTRRDLRKAVDGLVGRVNGKYGKTDYTPIQYMKKKLSHR